MADTIDISDEVLIHYGTKYHSGRYPYGSGENPYQHDAKFINRVHELEKKGLTEKEIADSFGYSIAVLRSKKSLSKTRTKEQMVGQAISMAERGYSQTAIANELGIPESTLRSMLKPSSTAKRESLLAAIDTIERNVNEKNYIDISPGTASSMGISEYKFKVAVQDLVDRGYTTHYIYITQHGNDGQKTTMKVLAKPGVTNKEVWENREQIGIINERFSSPTGTEIVKLHSPESISSKRVAIRYAEEGGSDKDGVIELRRGVDGLSLGNSRYAQVRIAVDGTHYLKGMAVYSDNMPPGVDIVFNTNKHQGIDKMDVMKKMSDDPVNPFGSTLKTQKGYLNIVREEGDWATWSKTLSSQMLSKQSVKLAREQLNLALDDSRAEYKDISALTNPTVKRHLLLKFADSCDADAVDLKAAALPRQSHNVILPLTTIKPNEIYAPGYKNGETVVLIRYPHGGTFEIPQLKVNNNNLEAKKMFKGNGNAIGDFVGIHPSVAGQLSGADFDGDTVLVIPNNTKKIQSKKPYAELAEFDPKASYPYYEGMKVISPGFKQKQMGVVSNLITDMTIQKASQEEIIRAVKHSMVVIDAEKHKLNYRQSAIDNDIEGLKKKYQSHPDGTYGGASTLISRSKSEERVPQRKVGSANYTINPLTGEKIFKETGESYIDRKTGKVVFRTSKSTKMAETKDAHTLSSGTTMESVYADYANSMKALANKARKDSLAVKDISYSPDAYKKYKNEVESLNAKLSAAVAHTPYERKARILADSVVKAKLAENPAIKEDRDHLRKIESQALANARAQMGGPRPKVVFTEKEWEAVQAGAIRKTKLENLLNYADLDQVKALAMPKNQTKLTPAKLAQARARLKNGFTQDEVAAMLGVSVSTLRNALSSQ